jgi:hypothetical protein
MRGLGNHLSTVTMAAPLVEASDLATNKDLAEVRHHKVVKDGVPVGCRNERPRSWKQKHPEREWSGRA